MKVPPLFLIMSLAMAALRDNPPPTKQIFDPRLPMYLGEVFWPPTMTFLAFLSPPDSSQHTSLTYWCWSAIDITNNILFNLGEISNLQMVDYFSKHAYIEREGKRWADCVITPEAGRMGVCEGVKDWDCIGGQRFSGPGTRKWSCFVNDLVTAMEEYEAKVEAMKHVGLLGGNATEAGNNEDGLTSSGGSTVAAPKTEATGTMPSSEIIGGFTASAI
ncbi:hypothetical protein HYALB_00009583 [Hymenoscyphus albidus]|uniref:Uncharacterized protein n=1 Tax=Hymenoscyphus albidus TaxID=595503 RepID=A0A9N9M4C0_9HELO|nr:hypothetical protein HYALB_00009583 [Hymenoscyphus albidus]